MPREEWYHDGLRFECTLCGACCTGAEGYVLITPEESRAIARRLGISLEAFRTRYTHTTSLGRSLKEVDTPLGRDCVFLDRTTMPGKALCSLYEARPTQCRTFPWWPEHLRDQRAWERLSKHCEGVGRGPFVPIEEIRIQRDAQLKAEPSASRAGRG